MIQLYIPALLVGWTLTACLLVIEHLLWRDAPRAVRYLLGGGALCAGCTVAGVIADNALLAVGPWAIASAGLLIVGWTLHEERAARARAQAQRSGELIGAARGLKEEIASRGNDRPSNQN